MSKVVCYFGSWAAYRQPPAQFTVDNIDPTLCTHLVYCFAVLDNNLEIASKDPWQDLEVNGGKAGFKRAVALKGKNKSLKVTLAVGGWNERSEKFSKMAATHGTRSKFIKSVLNMLRTYKFDGLDLDWEYPAYAPQGGKPEDKSNFVALVKELKEAFKPHRYILTAAIAGGKDKLDAGYDLPQLNRYLDLVHVMSYDYHGAWDGVVGANAPLRGSNPGDKLSVEYSVQYLLRQGISAHKLVLGVPFYGRTYVVQNPSTPIVFGRTPIQGSFPGPLIQEQNSIGYVEIRHELKNSSTSWKKHYDRKSETPYLQNGNKIISYDDSVSIIKKIKLAKQHKLAGIMVWSIETDDFQGVIRGKYRNYNLLRTVNHELSRRGKH